MVQMACTVFTTSPFTFTGKDTKALYFLMMLHAGGEMKEEVWVSHNNSGKVIVPISAHTSNILRQQDNISLELTANNKLTS